jgi:transposase
LGSPLIVPVKDVDEQTVLMLYRARRLMVRRRTVLVNALRAQLAAFGAIAPRGPRHVELLLKQLRMTGSCCLN